MSKAEQILLNRVKFIGENEWTLLGCPDDVIKELAKIEREARIKALEDILADDEVYHYIGKWGLKKHIKNCIEDLRELEKE